MSEAAPQVHIWRADPGAAVRSAAAIIATLTGVGLLAFFGISTSGEGAPASPLAHRLAVPGLMMLAGIALVGLSLLMNPREVRASPDGLELRMWSGALAHVPRDRILGVRLYHRRQALEVVQQRRASLYLTASNEFSPWSAEMGRALVALFGQTHEDRDYERSATRPDIIAHALRPTEFHIKAPSPWQRAHAVLALLLSAAAAVGWRPITRWLIEVELQGEGQLLWGALLALGLSCFVLLGVVEAWRLFFSNRTTGLAVSDTGITVRRQRGDRTLAADTIAGVEVRRSRGSRGPEVHIHLTRGGGITLHERAWAAEPGVLAGVLMHRFGQWDAEAALPRHGRRALSLR